MRVLVHSASHPRMKEVQPFSEYHDSLEQDHGKIAKSYTDFTIRHYGSSSTIVFDGYEEESRIREEDTMFIQLSASLMRQIYHARGNGSCRERLIPMNDM